MKTDMLKRLAIKRINDLAEEAQAVVLKHHAEMGAFDSRHSGFGELNQILLEIEQWSSALADA